MGGRLLGPSCLVRVGVGVVMVVVVVSREGGVGGGGQTGLTGRMGLIFVGGAAVYR